MNARYSSNLTRCHTRKQRQRFGTHDADLNNGLDRNFEETIEVSNVELSNEDEETKEVKKEPGQWNIKKEADDF